MQALTMMQACVQVLAVLLLWALSKLAHCARVHPHRTAVIT